MADLIANKIIGGKSIPTRYQDKGDGTFSEAATAGGLTKSIKSEFTRPADTTAYAVNDVVGNSTSTLTLLTFTGAGRVNGGSGYITKARVVTDQKTNVAQFDLVFYRVIPTAGDAIAADNAPYLLLWNNRDRRIGTISMPAMATKDATNSTSASALYSGTPLAFQCDAADSNLYAVLITNTAFTPASGQNFYVEITVEQN